MVPSGPTTYTHCLTQSNAIKSASALGTCLTLPLHNLDIGHNINNVLMSGTACGDPGRVLEVGVGPEGEGGGDDHQPGGAGQAQVRAVLARGGDTALWRHRCHAP